MVRHQSVGHYGEGYHLEIFPCGPRSYFQCLHHPGVPLSQGVGLIYLSDDRAPPYGVRKGSNGEHSIPPPQTPMVVGNSRAWAKIVRVTGASIKLSSDEHVFFCAGPRTILSPDIANMALAAETGGQDFVMRQAPWSNPRGALCAYRMPGTFKCSPTSSLLPPLLHLVVLVLAWTCRSGPFPHK